MWTIVNLHVLMVQVDDLTVSEMHPPQQYKIKEAATHWSATTAISINREIEDVSEYIRVLMKILGCALFETSESGAFY